MSPDRDLLTVFETDNPALLPVVRSLFQAADLPFSVQGEEAFGLFPVAGIGGPFAEHGLAVRFLVPADRAEEARALLAEIDRIVPEPAADDDDDGD